MAAVRRGIKDSQLNGWVIQQSQNLLIPGDGVAIIYKHANAHAALRRAFQPVGEHAAGLVAAKNIVLKIKSALRGVDHVCAQAKPVSSDADDAKSRGARVLFGRGRKLTAESCLLGMSEGHGGLLRKIGTRRQRCASTQEQRSEQHAAEPPCPPMRKTPKQNFRAPINELARFRQQQTTPLKNKTFMIAAVYGTRMDESAKLTERPAGTRAACGSCSK